MRLSTSLPDRTLCLRSEPLQTWLPGNQMDRLVRFGDLSIQSIEGEWKYTREDKVLRALFKHSGDQGSTGKRKREDHRLYSPLIVNMQFFL